MPGCMRAKRIGLEMRRYFKSGIALAVPVVLAVLACLPSYLHEAIPGDTRGVLMLPPWQDARPIDMNTQPGPGSEELVTRYYPWFAFLQRAAETSGSTLWNPLEGCGTPFFALWRTRCLSLFSIPFHATSLLAAFHLSFLLKLIIAGWGAFYLARRWGLAIAPAMAVGVAFEVSGPVLACLAWPISDVVAWLPLLVLGTERIAMGHRDRWPTIAVLIGLMALGGEPGALFTCILFALTFLLLRMAAMRAVLPSFGLPIAGMALGIGIGIALAAVQILPYLEFLKYAAGNSTSPALFHLRDLAALFIPWGAVPGAAPHAFPTPLLCAGIVPLGLLAVWSSLRGFVDPVLRQRLEALLVTSLFLTALAFAARAWSAVPLLKNLAPELLLAGNAMVLALVAGAAADAWIRLNAEECQAVLKRLPWVALVFLVATTAACAVAWHTLTWWQVLTTAGTIVALFALLVATLMKPSESLMGYGLSLLVIASAALTVFPSTAPNGPPAFPETSFTATLKQAGGRIGGFDALKSWPLPGNLVPEVYSPSGIATERQAGFAARLSEDPLLLRRAGVSALVLAKQDIQAHAAIRSDLAIRHVYPSGAVLFHDLDAKPRAWFAYEWRTDDAPAASGLPPRVEGQAPPAIPVTAPDAAVHISLPEQNNVVRVGVETPKPGLLVLADTYYPGWKATVDGEKSEIHAVDGAFRGVFVPEGKHQVVFRFSPASIKIGLVLSVLALAAIAVKSRHLFALATLRNPAR